MYVCMFFCHSVPARRPLVYKGEGRVLKIRSEGGGARKFSFEKGEQVPKGGGGGKDFPPKKAPM